MRHSTESDTDAKSGGSPCLGGHPCEKCCRKQQGRHWQQEEGNLKSRHPGRDGFMRDFMYLIDTYEIYVLEILAEAAAST